ncbi:S-ribosylhomocysteine lyase [uncultured Shewanella sp.]|uniref:S-ribosylhomocysteine lyase n=1 Tax=uncultured Shewanella sp. TaxID=173975 RepID=UPI002616FC8B|nr:S-ribosylhomocysteine lyase [uncultured Shewanella sp.]
MPLLDNVKVHHTNKEPPNVRIEQVLDTPKGDIITVYSLRFYVINKGILSEQGLHTLESLLVRLMRNYIDSKNIKIITLSQMGNRIGFFLNVIGQPSIEHVADSWLAALKDIVNLAKETKIPILDEHLGEPKELHSLPEAQEIAYQIIKDGINITDKRK